MRKMVWWLVLCNLIVWCMILCACGTSGQKTAPPAQQQSNITTIPVDQVDTNGDGHISQSEIQHHTTHDNSALLTFVCISAATIIMCVGGAWVTCRHRTSSHTSDTSESTDFPGETPDTPDTSDTQQTSDTSDDWPQEGDNWLYPDQDVPTPPRKT